MGYLQGLSFTNELVIAGGTCSEEYQNFLNCVFSYCYFTGRFWVQTSFAGYAPQEAILVQAFSSADGMITYLTLSYKLAMLGVDYDILTILCESKLLTCWYTIKILCCFTTKLEETQKAQQLGASFPACYLN